MTRVDFYICADEHRTAEFGSYLRLIEILTIQLLYYLPCHVVHEDELMYSMLQENMKLVRPDRKMLQSIDNETSKKQMI